VFLASIAVIFGPSLGSAPMMLTALVVLVRRDRLRSYGDRPPSEQEPEVGSR
jgi:hypothetical protein